MAIVSMVIVPRKCRITNIFGIFGGKGEKWSLENKYMG
jgi:hypothetical protein